MEAEPVRRSRVIIMGRVIFLLEEASMQTLLDGLLPRIFPGLSFLCVPHSGKTDLDRSIRTILRGWHEPDARFVVVRDNDNSDCVALKERLRQICREGRRDDAVIRIVCQELESWYLGDPDALAQAFGDDRLRHIKNRPSYRDPDARPKPSKDIERLVPRYRKIDGARRMAQCLSREGNCSHSFSVFLDAVSSLCPHAGGNLSEA